MDLRPLRILVVDDDAPTRRLLSAALTSEGLYEVVTARAVDEALHVFVNSADFDLLVVDLKMPSGSGLELLRQIRVAGHTLPVLILSSERTDQSLAEALECGASDYLPKPVNLHQLRRAVAYFLEQPRPAPPVGTAPISTASASAVGAEDGTFVEFTSLNSAAMAERFQCFAERVLGDSLGAKERGDLRLALEEIVHNAIEWGNANDPNKRLRLSCYRKSDRITIRVEDEGPGFDPTLLKDPSIDPQRHIQERRSSGKRMGGWGIFLARKMVDEVTFNRRGNVVFLTKYLRELRAPKTESSRTSRRHAGSVN